MNGIPLRLPEELLVGNTDNPIKQTIFVQELRQHFDMLRPAQMIRHGHRTLFPFKYIKMAMYVFIRRYAVKNTLKMPYEGRYEDKSRTGKAFPERLQFQSIGSNPSIFVVNANNKQTSAVREQKPNQPTASTACCCHRKPQSRTKRTGSVRSKIPSQFHVMQTTIPSLADGLYR